MDRFTSKCIWDFDVGFWDGLYMVLVDDFQVGSVVELCCLFMGFWLVICGLIVGVLFGLCLGFRDGWIVGFIGFLDRGINIYRYV